MECHSSSATCEADNQSYTTDNSSIVYSNYESGRGSPSYQQVDQIHQRDNLPPTHIYDVKINDSKEVHLGDRNIYNIDNFQVNAEQRAKRKKQICCFWIFFGALGSGGATSVALTVILAEPDPNFTTPEPEITTNMDTSSIMPDASSEANISKKLYDLIERVVWDSDFNENNPPAGIKLSSPAERIFISATGGLPCADLVSFLISLILQFKYL